jgi:hypothetical protein
MITNPFVVLSYVGGPALLTNATSLFVLSTSNRFARAIDRARVLAERPDESGAVLDELRDAHRRVDLIVRALTSFYFAAAMFALGTLATIAGAAIADIQNSPILNAVIGGAAIVGVAGFLAFVTGAICLVFEARLTARMISREARSAFTRAARA